MVWIMKATEPGLDKQQNMDELLKWLIQVGSFKFFAKNQHFF